MSKKRSRLEWERIVAERARRGETIVAAAMRHGVKAGTLAWWEHEFRRQRNQTLPAVRGRAGFVQLVSSPAPGDSRTLAGSPVAARLRLGDVHLELAEIPPAAWVVAVAKAARGGEAC